MNTKLIANIMEALKLSTRQILLCSTDLALKQVKLKKKGGVHVKNDLTGELLGYGKLYEYDDQLWIVFKGNVYPAEKVGEQYLVFNKEEKPWIAVNEEDDIDLQSHSV